MDAARDVGIGAPPGDQSMETSDKDVEGGLENTGFVDNVLYVASADDQWSGDDVKAQTKVKGKPRLDPY